MVRPARFPTNLQLALKRGERKRGVKGAGRSDGLFWTPYGKEGEEPGEEECSTANGKRGGESHWERETREGKKDKAEKNPLEEEREWMEMGGFDARGGLRRLFLF